ncbi:MAG TPA: pilus assembly protein [Rhabdaerophilum sp.]|nr:pilus assembly protein [Rhabdaerophilum sp.]
MMKTRSFLRFPAQANRRIRRILGRFRRSQSGVAAVEFALMIPAMMAVWVGMVIATDALTADKKVTLLARTLADMTTQMVAVGQSDMDSIFGATESVLWPHPSDRLGMRVTAIDIDGKGVAFVDWSVVPSNPAMSGGFSPLARCGKYTDLPAGLKVPRTSIILSEVTMVYKASAATQIVDEMFKTSGGTMPLGDSLYMRPRQSTKVEYNPAPGSACAGYVP